MEPDACRIPLFEIGRAEADAGACAEVGEPRAAVEGRWRLARRPGEAHRPRQDRSRRTLRQRRAETAVRSSNELARLTVATDLRSFRREFARTVSDYVISPT
ncbi:hypothetical protein ABZ519_20275 [Streptomyces collinus]|uniref:hypothetical protein n=1 Tax=Streptomyces collinus TaxID=42684 RepID=UPI0033F45673